MNHIENYFKKAGGEVLFESINSVSVMDDYLASFHYYVKVLCSDDERASLIEQCKHKSIDELLTVSQLDVKTAKQTLLID